MTQLSVQLQLFKFVLLLTVLYLCESTTNITIGGLFNIFDTNGNVNHDQLEHLGAFLIAINEINEDSTILPNHHLNYAIRSGVNINGAADATLSLMEIIDLGGVVSSFHNLEASTATQLLGADKIMTVNSMTDDTKFGTAKDYPYKAQTIPIEAFEGQVIQSILCEEHETRVIVFDSDDLFGRRYTMELTHNIYCEVEPLAIYSFHPWESDFNESVDMALGTGATIFLIFLSTADQTARLMETGYDHQLFREGTQIFMMHHDFVEHISLNYPIAEMLKGIISVEYQSQYSVLYTSEGQNFLMTWNNTIPLNPDCTQVIDNTNT